MGGMVGDKVRVVGGEGEVVGEEGEVGEEGGVVGCVLCDLTMLKRPATKTPSNIAKRSRVAATLDVKLDIVERHEHGEGKSVIGRVHGLAPSMVQSIVKSADNIKEMAGSATPLMATKVTRFCDAEMESMERMLSTWINDQTQRLKTPLSQRMIQQKAVETNSFQCKLTAIMRVRWLTTLAVRRRPVAMGLYWFGASVSTGSGLRSPQVRGFGLHRFGASEICKHDRTQLMPSQSILAAASQLLRHSFNTKKSFRRVGYTNITQSQSPVVTGHLP
ncbi:CENPB DNA-binding domain containing protein 1-like 11 [Homarus americanus]|uniref:CENPB DNA-binding domain containing protein 1-like 11 n=1 Tax=Homarus americanus TaxID=6706 RepID=A0A8J5TJC7_HOMAM|nr:CENPB DNA-binding domain containing protein 1-like 11 [Homarus americanus]